MEMKPKLRKHLKDAIGSKQHRLIQGKLWFINLHEFSEQATKVANKGENK